MSQPESGREVAASAATLLRAHYVLPDRAGQAAAAIEASLAAGEYDDLDELSLAERLTAQMHEFCADKHLRVRLGDPGRPRSPEAEPTEPTERAEPGPAAPAPSPADREKARRSRQERGRLDNFGIARVERLDGNVGYLDLRRMPDPANAGPAMAAAMELVSGTYALIIDLRSNGGGMPDGVIFWCSYLFPDGDTHLNDIFDAESGLTRQFWSLAYVPGRRYLDRPVYVLTSERTFSGAEELCYNLQAQGRAELIGETTGGGAHPTRMLPLGPAMVIAMPYARSVNPVTGTNWEGTGVVPDIAVPAAEARDVAYARALRHVLSDTLPSGTVPPPIADEASAALAALPAGGSRRP
ncbi:MAG TPA: S41 family peptidase [Streptosporangiaceae bacterium]|jgi:hypothetical protein